MAEKSGSGANPAAFLLAQPVRSNALAKALFKNTFTLFRLML
jgi:hypothetical protein